MYVAYSVLITMANGNNQLSRRKVLHATTIGASSISAISVAKGSPINTDDQVKIPVERRAGEVSRWKEMPEDWWTFEKHVQNVRDRIADSYMNIDGVTGVGIGTDDEKIRGKLISEIVLYIDEERLNEIKVPSSIEDISVVKKKTPNRDLDECGYSGYCNTTSYDFPPGGAHFDGSVTITTAVTHEDERKLMTTGHYFWDDSDCDFELDDPQEVKHEGQILGDAVKVNRQLDYALVEETNNTEVGGFAEQVNWTSSDQIQVSGSVTKSGLHVMKSNEETMYKYGARSCRSSGVVEGYTEDISWDGCVEDGVFVEVTACTQGGDSGSPYYKTWTDDNCIFDEGASIIGVHKGGSSYGAAAYRITEENIEFGTAWKKQCG